MAHFDVAPWMGIVVRAVQKGPDPYAQVRLLRNWPTRFFTH